jgi:hypothetical protein
MILSYRLTPSHDRHFNLLLELKNLWVKVKADLRAGYEGPYGE